MALPFDSPTSWRSVSKTGGEDRPTKTFYIREAIEEHVADLEDFFLAERRMRAYDPAENATLDRDDDAA